MSGLERGMARIKEQSTTVADDVENAFLKMSEGITDALQEMVESGKVDLNSLRNLASEVLLDISKGLLRRGVVNPLIDAGSGLIGDLVGSIGGSLLGGGGGGFGSLLAGIFHEGGTVGKGIQTSRRVPVGVFANAPRFHDGLFMRNDEFPAILQKGEQVIPKNKSTMPTNITINVSTPNAQSFMQNKGQVASAFFNEMARQARRNG
jgi:hypothetical protein